MKEVVLVHFACGHLDDARDREKECVWGGVGSLLLRFSGSGWLATRRLIYLSDSCLILSTTTTTPLPCRFDRTS